MNAVAMILDCNGTVEAMIVNPAGCENAGDVVAKAISAARNVYPDGPISVVEVRKLREGVACGLQADTAGECFWQI